MSGKQALLCGVLAAFGGLSAYVVYIHGVGGMWELMTANGVSMLLTIDLSIALTMVSAWMWSDARDRGLSPIPYVLLTVAAGSVGPLLYLIRRESTTTFERATIAAPTR
jgi:hypothetical protein